MLSIFPSKDKSTIAIEFAGKATKEDAQNLDRYVQNNFEENEKFNFLAIMHDIDGMTAKGIVNGVKFDVKRWKQFNKFAVISDKKWIEELAEAGTHLPGIKARHFNKGQENEAWDWIKK
ncbi:SpoIIAA family protein [Peribacillus glennii]|uniref:STAS/SEC14 domain-containing protein n=1 Tax=Peribacillus glennii TaxID=2303991 RepID=A0A372L8L0_9BACI|nr:STAS/SEC14 domain-containing protein [Peribacillus glennii]RFU61235.1 STAS/SEC14 domain-containing protein [Peribacillus glennii]